jgi:hypothetical protein
MGTWQEVCAIARKFGAQQLNDTAWLFQLQVAEEGRLQKVFVFYEFMRPDFEFMQIKSIFGPIQEVDLKKVIKGLGQLQVGAIGCSSIYANDGSEIDGMLNITTSIPLRPFDLSDPTIFIVYLHILARAADNAERNLAPAWAAGTSNGQASQAPRVTAPPPAAPRASVPQPAAPGQPRQMQDDKEWVRHLAEEYGRACAAVMEALEATLSVANEANGARKMADTRPQHEISIATFTNLANQKEREFGPLYQSFDNARARAKDVGTKLVTSCQQSDPELGLMLALDPETYGQTGAAAEYMRSVFGPTPRAFLEGISQGNAAINSSPNFGEPGFHGNIYHDSGPGELNRL